MALGAYENPQAYGVDFTKSTDILQRGMADAAAAMKNIAEQRVKARRELEENFSKFQELNYVEKIQGVNESINNSLKESAANFVSLADFSQMSPEEKQGAISSAKDARAGRDALTMIFDSAENNVLDPRIRDHQLRFVNDLINGDNVESVPVENGIGFKLVHTDRDGKKREYDSAKLAMMATQFQDVEPVFDKIDQDFAKTTASLQARRKAISSQTGRDLEEQDFLNYANQLLEKMELRDRELYFAEYVSEGEDLTPDMNGLSDAEKEQIKQRNMASLREHIAERLKNETYPEGYKPNALDLAKERTNRALMVAEKEQEGKGNDGVSDPDLLRGLKNMADSHKEYIATDSRGAGSFRDLQSRVAGDEYSLLNRPINIGGQLGTISKQELKAGGVLHLTYKISQYSDEVGGYVIQTSSQPIIVNLNKDGAISSLYRNILRAENKSGEIMLPNQESTEEELSVAEKMRRAANQ